MTATLTAFVDAFNRGDQAMLAQFFPAEAINGLPPMFPTPDPKTNEIPFMWYSVGGPRGGFNPGFTAHNRAELLAYFRERHAHHEQLRLLRLEVGTGGYPGVGFLYDLARQADDIPSHVAGGKGVMNCPTRTIFVWSMGERSVLPYFTTPNGTPGYG